VPKPFITVQLLRLFLFSLLLGVALPSLALVVDSAEKRYNLFRDIQIFVDTTRNIKSEEIIAHPERFDFQPTSFASSEINFGFSNAIYWIKIPLSQNSSSPSNWILELPYLGLDEVCFYAPGSSVVTSGAIAPISARPFQYRFFSFPLTLTQDAQNFYLRVESSYAVTIPLRLYTLAEFNYEQITDTLIQALYYGGLLSLLFYNFILFFTIRDRQYLIYCFFTAFTGLGVFAGNGYARLYLWPEAIAWDQISQNTLFGFAGIFAMTFTAVFLRAKKYQPRLALTLHILALAYLVLSCLFLLTLFSEAIPRVLVFEVFFITTLFASLACLYGSFIAIRMGQSRAIFFALAWGSLSIGAIIASLRSFSLVPSNGFTLYALQIGSGLEMLLFSFALAYRIQSERLKKEQAQTEALIAKQSVIEVMKGSEERLEKAVEVRTEKLQQLLVNEQQIHDKYVRFVSMIAHEFRNPLNIIEGQSSMMELESESGIDNIEKRVAAIRGSTARLANLFEQWLQSDRINHPGSQLNMSSIDVGKMLEELVKTARGFHPDHHLVFVADQVSIIIHCDLNLLQIAILNLIDNACKYSPLKSTVKLSLMPQQDDLAISVSDEGCGIKMEDAERIFDAYFRADNENKIKGTGLGLAFVKRISELHGGRIEVHSRPHAGSTFTIWLPY
jgi:signal transduction histidine kinase